MQKDNPRIAIIGAGCSGITTIKNLAEAGLTNLVCFEQNDQIGGNWIFSPKISHSSVCETTHIISSKKLSEYLDYPMPEHYPDYPSHTQLLAYFQSYAQTFDIEQYIRFNTKVSSVVKNQNETWTITPENGNPEKFDFLLVANGHHSEPRIPEFSGHFSGKIMHSHEYKTSAPFKDQRVLIVGMGNSACDCAVEISRVADFVAISQRHAQYVIPKFMMGKPTDIFNETTEKLPRFMRGFFQKLGLYLQVGSYKNYGLLTPKHGPTDSHPTVNSELLYKIRHGKVHPRRGIESFDKHAVQFTDGQTEDYDTIILATGYKIATPFFDPNFLDYSDADRVPLYLRMFHPTHPSLIFIGLFQPQGAIWPASDAQARLAAKYISGKWTMPENIAALAEQDSDEIERLFLKEKRHTIEVNYNEFMGRLREELRS
ncbi:MAG: NAD(P)-binding domain-containing protein [Saprospiraceae bacterium]|nr:NAD(P)-binding domain-containing protein [Bacteroidia bacterium]NNK90030.1 NAD(P)-binding domain-containing protein [Saprospiraceae bacterium]